jgi:hypothetical protein
MGYELHIFRRNNWDDENEESNITIEEWLYYIENDSELILDGGYYNYFKEWIEDSSSCIWKAHPNIEEDDKPNFTLFNGSITVKNPDDFTILKMVQIASSLNSKVQGDDLEYYDETYFDNINNELEIQINNISEHNSSSNKKSWWKFWQVI